MSLLGGGLGVGLAFATEPAMFQMLGNMFPGYTVTNETIGLGLLLAVGIGVVAGLAPAIGAGRLRVVEAMRAL